MADPNLENVGFFFFFFQAEDGIRDIGVTGVQTCALPISPSATGWLNAVADTSPDVAACPSVGELFSFEGSADFCAPVGRLGPKGSSDPASCWASATAPHESSIAATSVSKSTVRLISFCPFHFRRGFWLRGGALSLRITNTPATPPIMDATGGLVYRSGGHFSGVLVGQVADAKRI